MTTPISTNADLYSMEMDRDTDTILLRWNKFPSRHEFREGTSKLLEYVRSKNVSKLIIDTSDITVLQEVKEECALEEWVPKVINAGIQYSAIVRPDSVVAKMDMEDIIGRMNDYDYTTATTDSIAAAREWIASK